MCYSRHPGLWRVLGWVGSTRRYVASGRATRAARVSTYKQSGMDRFVCQIWIASSLTVSLLDTELVESTPILHPEPLRIRRIQNTLPSPILKFYQARDSRISASLPSLISYLTKEEMRKFPHPLLRKIYLTKQEMRKWHLVASGPYKGFGDRACVRPCARARACARACQS